MDNNKIDRMCNKLKQFSITNDVTDIIQYVNKAVKQPKKFTITSNSPAKTKQPKKFTITSNSPKNNKN